MVKYPELRKDLIEYLQLMADPDAAYEEWVGENRNIHDSFLNALDFFFEDAPLRKKEVSIGLILKNEEEWDAILELKARVDDVFKHVGSFAPDEEYLADEHWPELVKVAKKALAIFEAE